MSAEHDYPELHGGGLSRVVGAVVLVLLAIASLALLIPASGIVKRNRPPADMPWFGSGLNSVFVLADGTWIISRSTYVDRKQRYEISADGELQTFSDRGVFRIGLAEDVSGGFSPGARTTKAGQSLIAIKPSAEYYSWLSGLRHDGDHDFLNPLPTTDRPPPYTVSAQEVQLTLHPGDKPSTTSAGDATAYYHDQVLTPPKTGVAVRLNQRVRLMEFLILPGHWYFDIADDAAFIDPYLYITTDRQRMLHKLRIEDPPGQLPEMLVERSALTGVPQSSSPHCQIGLDPRQGRLFLLRPEGDRFWFDPDTLEPAGQDKLPGNWEPEYAQLSQFPGPFSPYFGTPLSERGYNRLMQAAMLVFLASLLGLSLLWRPRWKSTSAATTADSSSSAHLESTSADSATP
jgi:hypothetical protein